MSSGVTAMEHVLVLADDIGRARRLGLPVTGGSGPGPVDHIAFRGSDYDKTRALLDRKGVPAVLNTVPGGGPRQVFVQDPSGVRIEINFMQHTGR